jgi:hypothetical protein
MTSSAEPDPVAAYLAALDHPRKAQAAALCAVIVQTCPDLRRGLKWNAPSFGKAGQDDWLTLRLHPAPAFQLILHRGAKPMAEPPAHPMVPKGLVQWKSPDRGVVDFAKRDPAEVAIALAALIRDWMAA